MWWFNPWREVRRLEKSCDELNRNWCDALSLLEECGKENEYLRGKIAEQSKWVPRGPIPLDKFLDEIRQRKEELGITNPVNPPGASGTTIFHPVRD